MEQIRTLLLPGDTATDLPGPGCSTCKTQTQQGSPKHSSRKERTPEGKKRGNCEAQGAPPGNASPGASILMGTLSHPAPAAASASALPSYLLALCAHQDSSSLSTALKACLSQWFSQRHVCRGPPGGHSGPCSAQHMPLRRVPKDHCVTLITLSATGVRHQSPSPFSVRDLC